MAATLTSHSGDAAIQSLQIGVKNDTSSVYGGEAMMLVLFLPHIVKCRHSVVLKVNLETGRRQTVLLSHVYRSMFIAV